MLDIEQPKEQHVLSSFDEEKVKLIKSVIFAEYEFEEDAYIYIGLVFGVALDK
jgi:hypothetical protein